MTTKADLRERPLQAEGEFMESDDRSDLLPALAKKAGFELRSVTFRLDPFVLYNRFGQILYEWPCGVEPHWQDVYETCQQFL